MEFGEQWKPAPLNAVRLAVGRRMAASKREVPHFYVAIDIEMDAALAALDQANEQGDQSERVSLTAVLVMACADTLRKHPQFNAVWSDGQVLRSGSANICVAIALEDGVIAPALMDSERHDLRATGVALRDLVGRTRAKRLSSAELTNGTFTLSNLGMYGITAFAAIVTQPQIATLATGTVSARPVIVDGVVAPRSMMTACLSADHRVVDGADSARFLSTLKATLESPDELARLASGTR